MIVAGRCADQGDKVRIVGREPAVNLVPALFFFVVLGP